MVKTKGFFLKGLAGSLQGMPQRVFEVRWKAKEEKKLQVKQNELREALSLYTNTVTELQKDGYFSQDDVMKLNTIMVTGGAEFQDLVKTTHSHIQAMSQAQVEQDFELVDSFIEMTKGIDIKDMPGALETIRRFVKSEGALTKLKAYDTMYEGQYKTTQEGKALDIVGKLPQEYKYPYLREKGIVGEITPTPTTPTMANEKLAVSILSLFANASPETFEKKKTDLERTGLDLSVYTQDILKEKGGELRNLYDTPEEVMAKVKAPVGLMVIPKRDTTTGEFYASFSKKAVTTTPGERVTSLPLQEDYKQKALDANTLEDKKKIVGTYEKAGYNISEMPTDQEWINTKLGELDTHVEMLEEITDEEGKLIGGKKFKFLSGDEEESQTGEEWYKDIYEAYVFYLEELRKMGIDVSKYRKIKSPGEVSKVGFFKGMFTGGGVERGYPSIYY